MIQSDQIGLYLVGLGIAYVAGFMFTWVAGFDDPVEEINARET